MKQNRRFWLLLFGAYLLALLLLLFRRTPVEHPGINLLPLHTIRDYFLVLRREDPVGLALRPYAVLNFAGNLLAFLPLGAFFPLLFRRQRRFFPFLFTAAGSICAVELLQYFTRRGSLDVDDLLLNLPGACVGWLLWKLGNRKQKRRIL